MQRPSDAIATCVRKEGLVFPKARALGRARSRPDDEVSPSCAPSHASLGGDARRSSAERTGEQRVRSPTSGLSLPTRKNLIFQEQNLRERERERSLFPAHTHTRARTHTHTHTHTPRRARRRTCRPSGPRRARSRPKRARWCVLRSATRTYLEKFRKRRRSGELGRQI